jgi:hypothetical protein
LVKSPPELWAELSEVENLERHLGEFGEIKITRAEPETTVAWEGENASGTVELEPTGWGTKVTITADVAEAAEPESEAVEPVDVPVSVQPEPILVEAEPVSEVDPGRSDPGPLHPEPDCIRDAEPAVEPRRRGFFTRFLLRKRRETPPPPPAYGASEHPEEAEPELRSRSAQEPPAQPEPEPRPQPEPVVEAASSPDDDEHFEFDFALARGDEQPEAEEPPCEPIAPERAKEVLETALENLGQAHHRPFSRD